MLKKYAANHERTASDVVRDVIEQLVAIDDAERAAKSKKTERPKRRERRLRDGLPKDNVVHLHAS